VLRKCWSFEFEEAEKTELEIEWSGVGSVL
jgi:hypothetical protein